MTTDKKKKAILSGLLFVSVAINLGLIAYGAGIHERKDFKREPRELSMMRGLEHAAGNLPPETRGQIRAAVEKSRPAMKAAIEAIGQQRGVVRDLMLQPVPDTQALTQAFAELRRRTDAAQAIAHGTIAEVAPLLPPDQRPMVRRKPPEMPPRDEPSQPLRDGPASRDTK